MAIDSTASSQHHVSGETPKLLWQGGMPHPESTDYGPQITAMIVNGRLFRRGSDGICCFDLRAEKQVLTRDA